MNVQTLKGFRDFLPAEARKRNYVIGILKSVFESYGFEPLETPALEYEEILLGKYGEEGDKLMYRFEDNGKRRVALRYDQTVPLARVVAQYQNNLAFPFNRYQIQPVWRAENTQKGRFREFVQCDIDSVGTPSLLADAAIIEIATASLEALGFKNYKILINDRKIFDGVKASAIPIIDKLEKIGEENVKRLLQEEGLDNSILDQVQKTPPTEDVKQIMKYAEELGVEKSKILFSPTLARGLDYYTGMIFEIKIDGYTTGSVCGGGRYDNLIGMFAGRSIPAVGCAFGFDRLIEAMQDLDLFSNLQATTVLVTVFSPELLNKSIKVCELLNKANIPQELYFDPEVKMEKQLKYADQKRIPYVVIIGPDEAEKNLVTLRNMKTREQKTVNFEEMLNFIV